MRLRLLGLIVGLATVTGAVLIATTSSAGASFRFSFTEHQTNVEFAVGGSAPSATPPQSAPNPGDRVISRSDLLQGNTKIGFDNVVCTVTFNNDLLCDVVSSITNKGDIHATALLQGGASANGPSVFDAVVDGGTFAYGNAHGDAHVVALPNGDNQISVNLVTQ
jgi:hypothetical protein